MSIKFISLSNSNSSSSELIEPNFKRLRLQSNSNSFEFDNKENFIAYCKEGGIGNNSEAKVNNGNTNLKKRLIEQEPDINSNDKLKPFKISSTQYTSGLSTIPINLLIAKKSKVETSSISSVAVGGNNQKTKFNQNQINQNNNSNQSQSSNINFENLIDCNYSELIDYWFPSRNIEDENFLS